MKCSSSYLLFMLLWAGCIWNISAHTREQLGRSITVTKVNDVSTIKGDDVHKVVRPPTATKGEKSIGGRKMVADYKAARLEKGIKVVADGASKIKSSKLGGKSCGSHECKQSSRASRFDSEKGGGDAHEYAGFVAFSQDYNSPRHHPPKNN